ncbi:MAG: cation-transporting P-type ATPase [Candidatus Bathyarchaeota archaeon]|nr:cation-transporting P-type ATPase [Candidatus Bathyarchaeota archaeon]
MGERSGYDEYALSRVDEVYRRLQSGPDGLTGDKAADRLQKYGPNTLPSAKKRSLTSRTILQIRNAFNLLLLFASSLSFFSGYAYSDPGSVQMGAAILAVVIINVAFSIFQEYRAEQAVQTITKMIPTKAKVLRNAIEVEVEVSEVVPGDIVVLDEGDRVPADLRLVSAFEVSVDNSILTGESEALRRFVDMTPGMTANNVAEYQNLLFAGTTMVSGVARGVVLTTGKDTQFGRIVALSSQIEDPLSPLQRDIDRTAKLNLVLSVAVGALFFLVAKTFVNLTIIESILFAIGVMISLVPEGFQLTVSLSLAITALGMAKRHVVVKRLSAIETIGSMTVLCVDKTGTITSGEMMVEKLWATGKVFEVTGDGYSPEGFVTVEGRRINPEERPHLVGLFEVSAFCTNAKLVAPTDRIGRWAVLGDPTDGAFLVFAGKGDFNAAIALAESPRTGFMPFDSARRMMTVIHATPDGSSKAYTKGSCYDVLARCTSIFNGGKVEPLTDAMMAEITRQITAFASDGYRVLAMASRELPPGAEANLEVEKEMTFLGLAALRDPPRPKTEAAVRQAKSAGVRVIMITGDHELTAEAVARRVGILSDAGHVAVTGSELNRMSDEELSRVLDTRDIVFARTTPEHKLRVVSALMAKGETVAVTGDGVNDSPALIEANVGIAMGAGGTDVARESADMVLLDNDFTSIVEGLRLGRATYDNLRKFVYYVYTHNFAELVTFVAFIILGIPLPLLVIQVLAIDLILEIPVSLALITEPPESDVLERPPRARSVRLMDGDTLGRAAIIGVIVGVVAVLYAFYVWGRGGWHYGSPMVADPRVYAMGTTAVLVGIMAGQIGNLISTRVGLHSALKSNPFTNKWIPIGILIELALLAAVVYAPFLQPIFGTAALAPEDWLTLSLLAPAVLLIDEVRKYLARRGIKKGG